MEDPLLPEERKTKDEKTPTLLSSITPLDIFLVLAAIAFTVIANIYVKKV